MNYSRVEKYHNQKSKKIKKGLATALMGTVLVSPIALSSISANADTVPAGTKTTQTEWTANSVETVRSEMQAQGLNLNDVNGDYVVRQGDTLSAISIAAHESMQQIANDNHISNLNLIYVGQILHLHHTEEAPILTNGYVLGTSGNGTKVALPSRTAEQVKANAMVNQGIMPNATVNSIATPAGHATSDKTSDKAGNQAAKNDGSSAKADHKADNKANGTNATSQAANHGSHASSASSASSVNGGKHDQAATSSSAKPATSNSQASSSKPSSSTANKPADKPTTSGSQASSSSQTPAQGSSSTTPSQGSSSTTPSQGSSSQTPSQGSSSTTPSQGGNTTTPSQGSSSTTPSQGSSSQTPDYNKGVVNADGTTNYQAAMNQKGPWDGQSTSTDDFGRSQAEQTWKENHPGAQMTGQGYADGSTSQVPVYSGQDEYENAARPQMSQQQLDETNQKFQQDTDASQTFGNGIQWVSSDYKGEVAGNQSVTVDNPVNTPYEDYTSHTAQIDSNVVKQMYGAQQGPALGNGQYKAPDGAHYVSSTITNAGEHSAASNLSGNTVNLTFYK